MKRLLIMTEKNNHFMFVMSVCRQLSEKKRQVIPASFMVRIFFEELFALSSLEFGLFPELFMFMLAHLLLAPLLYIPHTYTSFVS